MQALELLNPCRVCNVIASFLLLALGIIIGGYGGKYIYVSTSAEHLNWSQVLLSDNFWTPDWSFWCFGLSTVVIIFSIVAIVNSLIAGVWWGFTRSMGFCWRVLVMRCCCCWCDYNKQATTIGLLDAEEAQHQPNINGKHAYTFAHPLQLL